MPDSPPAQLRDLFCYDIEITNLLDVAVGSRQGERTDLVDNVHDRPTDTSNVKTILSLSVSLR